MPAGEQVAVESGIANSLKTFAAVRTRTIRLVSGLTPEQANFAPAANAWSVAQILDHLLLTEALYRTQMSRLLALAKEGKGSNIDVSLEEVDLTLPFIPRMLMPAMAMPLTMLNLFVPQAVREALLRFPILKAKNPKISEPSPARPIAELRDRLSSSLAQTSTLLSGDLPRNAGRVTVSHPVLGRNTIANILGLMAAHEERHGGQIQGVLRHTVAS